MLFTISQFQFIHHFLLDSNLLFHFFFLSNCRRYSFHFHVGRTSFACFVQGINPIVDCVCWRAYVWTSTSFSISCRKFKTAKNAVHLIQMRWRESKTRMKIYSICAIVHRVLENVQIFRPYAVGCFERRFSPSYMVAYIRIIRFDAIFYPLSHSSHFLLSSYVLLWLVRVGTRTSCKHVSDGINHTYAKIKDTGMALTNGRYYLHSTILLLTLLCGDHDDDVCVCGTCAFRSLTFQK